MKRYFYLSILPLFFLFACNENRIYSEHTSLDQIMWSKTPAFKHVVDIQDITSAYKIMLDLRHTSHIKYGEVLVLAKITTPEGEVVEKNYTAAIRDKETGQLLGEALGDLCDTQAVLDAEMKFPVVGKYTFEFTHTMKDDDLAGFIEVGLVIDKIPSQK